MIATKEFKIRKRTLAKHKTFVKLINNNKVDNHTQIPEQLLGNSHYRRRNDETKDDHPGVRMNWQIERTDRLSAERQQICHQSQQPLQQRTSICCGNILQNFYLTSKISLSIKVLTTITSVTYTVSHNKQ